MENDILKKRKEIIEFRKVYEKERERRHEMLKKAVRMLKDAGVSNEEISKGMDIPESVIRNLI